jgi:thymidine phosphorylase
MNEILNAQGRRAAPPPLARLTYDVVAEDDGVVTGIDNERLARIARLAGAPKVKGAGVDLFRKLGEKVVRGEPLYRIYADSASELEFARQVAGRATGYSIGAADEVPRVFVEF